MLRTSTISRGQSRSSPLSRHWTLCRSLILAVIDVDEPDRTVTIDKKGKGKAKCEPMVHVLPGHVMVDVQEISASSFANGDVGRSWAWKEKAMYQRYWTWLLLWPRSYYEDLTGLVLH
jgi:hypothetical protein